MRARRPMRDRVDLAVVIGTRPEAIKLAPVLLAARSQPSRFNVRIIRTGQHRELVDQVLAEFQIVADHDLDIMQSNQDLAHVMAESIRGLSDLFARHQPDWVLVQGDTTTTLAGSLAAFYTGVRLGHVEAGLRTGRRHSPFPEEMNRTLTARLADLHFAPTEEARDNLLREGTLASDIFVTGNTVVDALMWTRDRPGADGLPAKLKRPYLLVTAHRRENHGAALHRICDAVVELLRKHVHLHVYLPMHPSPAVRSVLLARLGSERRVSLAEPLGYGQFVRAIMAAELVLTDSGGVQEECAALGKPVLVLRADTERNEAVASGVAILVGTDPNCIVETASALLSDRAAYDLMAQPSSAFGVGTASTKILDALWGAGQP